MLVRDKLTKEVLEDYKRQGLSTHQIARLIGCSQPYVSKVAIQRGIHFTREKGTCIVCGNTLNRGKKYCSHQCQKNEQHQKLISQWLSGEWNGLRGKKVTALSKTIRDYLLKQADYKCSKCGWAEVNESSGMIPLEINHIDGNHKNNRPENLEVVCPNCHALTPNFRGLNKNSTRTHR
jgi:5-methylcytosine-specific restriction endonuclease McrA